MKTFAPIPSVLNRRHSVAALTLIEVLAIIGVLFILAGLLLPSLANRHPKSRRIKCVSNLKQVGIAYRLWSGDHSDIFPMSFMVTNGDSIEPAFPPVATRIFQVLSNELNDPKILVCPNDTERLAATNFSTDFRKDRVGYFVGLDADEKNPQSLLSGDRNITNGLPMYHGILEVTTNRPTGWTEKIHMGQGNIGLADGSVQQFSSSALRKQISNTGLTTNRLAMP